MPSFKTTENASQDSSASWYAAYTKHQHEKSAAELLCRKGIEVLLPLYSAAHKWKDRSKIVRLPLFPCYFFLHVSLDQRIEILKTPGVCWFVGSRGRPSELPVHEIEAVRRITQSSAPYGPHPFLKSGDRVRIQTGSLTGLEGFLTRFKNRYRVVLSVELVQKSVAVEVEVSAVKRLEASITAHSRSLPENSRTMV